MPNFQAISRERHTKQRWKPNTSMVFTDKDGVVPLGADELPLALHAMPIVFLQTDNVWMTYGLLGFKPHENVFVNPEGRWLADYLPQAYRHYPFLLAKTAEGTPVLCVDEDSGLLDERDGELLLEPDGTPSKSLGLICQQLAEVADMRVKTRTACALLNQHQLIKPMPIKVQGENGVQDVEGLHCVDEAVLNQLSAEALCELRDQGALLMAYCQLLSVHHLQNTLPRLTAMRKQARAPLPTKKGELDLSFLENRDTMSFS